MPRRCPGVALQSAPGLPPFSPGGLQREGPRGASLSGVRRVHPSERTPALAGWDVLQLLAFFRVGKLQDVPWASDQVLAKLPLAQVWPSLGNANGV